MARRAVAALAVAFALWLVPAGIGTAQTLQGGVSQNVLRGGVSETAPGAGGGYLGDVFQSNGAPGGSRGNTTYKTGTQSRQQGDPNCGNPFGCARGTPYFSGGTGSDVYCQQSPGMPERGPYSHTGTNTPCGPAFQRQPPQPAQQSDPAQQTQQTQQPASQPVFNYYYVNGINTPDRPPAGTKGPARGNYQWDWKLIRANLLDLDPAYMGLGPKKTAVSIKVANETDVMAQQTQNPSGKDPVSNQQLDALCTTAQLLSAISGSRGGTDSSPLGAAVAVCGIYNQMVATLNDVRGNGFKGMAPGDIFECFRQALAINLAYVGAAFGLPGIPTGMDAFSSQQPEVQKIGNYILQKYRSEKSSAGGKSKQNYFIVIGHSQGNFFVEAVAYWLLHDGGADGAYVFHNRLGLLSFASPTDYGSVINEPGFGNRVAHIKRRDDMINALLALPPGAGKRPFTTGDSPSLWPFPGLDWSNWRQGAAAFSAMGDPVPDGCTPAGTPQCDGALYTPFLNSHLLENYIADANFSMPGQPINAKTSAMFRRGTSGMPASGTSPATAAPLLDVSRRAVVSLKRALLDGAAAQSQAANTPTATSAAQGFDPAQALNQIVNGLFR